MEALGQSSVSRSTTMSPLLVSSNTAISFCKFETTRLRRSQALGDPMLIGHQQTRGLIPLSDSAQCHPWRCFKAAPQF